MVTRTLAVVAQGQTDFTTDLPSGTWLLAVLVVGFALYLSYRLGAHRRTVTARRREGPVSRALSKGTTRTQGS